MGSDMTEQLPLSFVLAPLSLLHTWFYVSLPMAAPECILCFKVVIQANQGYRKFKMSEARPPPLLGQHTTHILKEVLRYDDRAIRELLSTGVVTQHEVE